MRAAWVRAERDSEVRRAAHSWREAGAIDGSALSAIEALYPAVWRTPGPLWGALVFFFVSFFVVALLISTEIAHLLGLAAFLLAAGLIVAADRLRPSTSTVGTASAAAGAFWSVVCLLIAIGQAVDWKTGAWTLLLFAGAAAWAAAAFHWGYPTLAAFAAAFFFLLLARSPAGRALWLALGAALTGVCAPLLDRPALAPSHRRSTAAVLAVSLAAVYAAINLYALDHRLVEKFSDAGWRSPEFPGSQVRLAAAIATAVFPVVVLAWGIRSRRTLLLDAGIIAAALSLATLRFYVYIAPLWAILSAAGGGLILLALGVHRWLARASGGERGGFTARRLFEDEKRQQTLGALGAVSLAPHEGVAAPEPGRYSGGGGSYGGGGSSGTF